MTDLAAMTKEERELVLQQYEKYADPLTAKGLIACLAYIRTLQAKAEDPNTGSLVKLLHVKDEEINALNARIANLEANRIDLYDTLRAISVDGLGLSDPLADDAPSEPPAEWQGKLSEKVAALRVKAAALDALGKEWGVRYTNGDVGCPVSEGAARILCSYNSRALVSRTAAGTWEPVDPTQP